QRRIGGREWSRVLDVTPIVKAIYSDRGEARTPTQCLLSIAKFQRNRLPQRPAPLTWWSVRLWDRQSHRRTPGPPPGPGCASELATRHLPVRGALSLTSTLPARDTARTTDPR